MAVRIVKNTIQQEWDRLIKSFDQIDPVLDRSGQRIITTISKRTDKGINAEGRSFKRYKKAYQKFRQSKGRSAKVNLQFTGEMLRSMFFQTGRRFQKQFVRVMFPTRGHSKAKISTKLLAQIQDLMRPFFNLSKTEQTKEEQAIDKDLTRFFRARGF